MASHGVNKVILIGRLGQDPEVRRFPNGGAIATTTLATSESWNDRATGEKKEKTEWHRVVFSGKLADIVEQYLKKGVQVYVEGKLQTRKWQDKDGRDQYTTEVMVGIDGVMQMLGSRQDNAGYQAQAAQPSYGQPAPQAPQPQYNAPPAAAPQTYNQAPAPQAPSYNAPAQPSPYGGAPSTPPPQAPTYNAPPADFDDDIPF